MSASRKGDVSLGTVAVAGAGIFGLSTWAGLVLNELAQGMLAIRLTVIVVIAAGWLIPASYCVFALRGQSRWLSRLLSSLDIRAILPQIAIPGVLVMLHLIALIPAMKERVPLLLWPCLATLVTWSFFYHMYRQRPLWACGVHVILDTYGVFAAIDFIWPRIAGATAELAAGSSSYNRIGLAAVALSGMVASVLMTSAVGARRSVWCRLGNWLAGVLLFAVVLHSAQGSWNHLSMGNYIFLGFAALFAVAAWVVGLRDLRGARRAVVSNATSGEGPGATDSSGTPAHATTAPSVAP